MVALFSDLFVKINDDVTWLLQLDLFIIQPMEIQFHPDVGTGP